MRKLTLIVLMLSGSLLTSSAVFARGGGGHGGMSGGLGHIGMSDGVSGGLGHVGMSGGLGHVGMSGGLGHVGMSGGVSDGLGGARSLSLSTPAMRPLFTQRTNPLLLTPRTSCNTSSLATCED